MHAAIVSMDAFNKSEGKFAGEPCELWPDTYFDGQVREFTHPDDFAMSPKLFIDLFDYQARRRGLVANWTTPDKNTVLVYAGTPK